MTHDMSPVRCRVLLAGSLLIVGLTLVAYWPALGNGFVWDDDAYVTNNQALTQPGGFARIWLDLRANPQYYPVTFSSFYLEHALWGFNPTGYHAVNILLHAGNAVLVWWTLRRLGVPGSWLAAALFAIHPVEVESVAWITERKNLLSGFFGLAALGAYLQVPPFDRAVRPEPSRRFTWWWYALSIGLFVLALLSKSVTATLAAVVFLLLWWKRPRLETRDLLPLLPFFILGASLGLNTARLEVQHVGAHGPDFRLTPLERLLVAGQALWFYAGKLVAPVQLGFIYPRWEIDTRRASQWLPVLAAALAVAALVLLRRRLGRGPLVAVLCYVAMLFPVLGFLNVYPMRYSFVADHFQYHASVALLALIAAAAARGFPGLGRRPVLAVAAVLPALVLLGCLTWSRCFVYRDPVSLWTDTLVKNPAAWMAHTNLGSLLIAQGRHREAFEHRVRAIELRPNDMLGYLNLGNAYLRSGDLPQAIATYERGLACPNDAPLRRGKLENNLASALGMLGDLEGAIRHFRRAVREDPLNAEVYLNLGKALASRGQTAEAIEQLQLALRLNPEDAEARDLLNRLIPSPRESSGGEPSARPSRESDASGT
jgi:tetratricopeptide (TPR) repeat protein